MTIPICDSVAQAKDATAQKAGEVKDAAGSKAEDTKKQAGSTYDDLSKKAGSAAEDTKKQAGSTYDDLSKKAGDAKDTAAQKAGEVGLQLAPCILCMYSMQVRGRGNNSYRVRNIACTMSSTVVNSCCAPTSIVVVGNST